MFDDFKRFMLRGNVIDMGVGVVIGVAFKSVVDALVVGLMTPLIAAVGGQADFSALSFTINNSQFLYGEFINAMISFLITGIVVFYVIVRPVNALMSRYREEETPDPTTRKCPQCISEIPLHATRCAFCTSTIEVAA